MQQVRLNFLNWRPDSEASGHDGLVKASNVLHDSEGYKQFKLATAGAASTALSFSGNVTDVQVRQIGSKQDSSIANKIHCILESRLASGYAQVWLYPPNLTGSDATVATLTMAGGTTATLSGGEITALEVCEMEDYVFITAEAKGNAALATEMSARLTAYMAIDLA